MVFSTPIFLFLFLPIVLASYFIVPQRFKNLYLLSASLLFYFWGQKEFIFVMIFSIIINYFLVILIDNSRRKINSTRRLVILILGIQFNIGLLVIFKYLPFLLKIFNPALVFVSGGSIQAINILLAAGISFYTFHAISYLVDVYRGERPQKNLINSSLYIALFPQLVAGPIIRYHTIAAQLIKRRVSI